jgi:excisionase family DNA binding protein
MVVSLAALGAIVRAKTNQTLPEERPLTVKETAARLACSPDHVLNMIARGDLPAVRVPGLGKRAARVLVLPADLAAAMQAWRVSA